MLSDTNCLFLIMKENKLKKVAPEQGSEPQSEEVLLRTRNGLIADLRTARVLCHIVGSNPDVQQVIIHALQKDITTVPDKMVLQRDALMSSALLRLIMDNSIMVDNLVEIIDGLQRNLLNKKEFKDLVEKMTK